MSRRRRLGYPLHRDEFPFLCAAWVPGRVSTKEEIGHVLFGRAVGDDKVQRGLLELAQFDFKEYLLSDVVYEVTEEELTRCLAVHPGGDGVLCAFENKFKLYELERKENTKLRPSDRDLVALEGFGPQHFLLFSPDGCRLAACGKDGRLRVFEWPGLEIIFDHPDGHRSFKDLDISLDGAFLASIVDDGASCYVWDIMNSKLIATLSSDRGDNLGCCRFSRDGTRPFLFITTNKSSGGRSGIAVWEMDGWSKLGVKKFSDECATAFAISRDGKRLAIASSGNILVIEIRKMEIVERIRNTHLLAITAMEFSFNCRALLSKSADSTARITAIKTEKEWKEWQIYLLLTLMVLASAILFYMFFEYSDSFWKFPMGRMQPARPTFEAKFRKPIHPDN